MKIATIIINILAIIGIPTEEELERLIQKAHRLMKKTYELK